MWSQSILKQASTITKDLKDGAFIRKQKSPVSKIWRKSERNDEQPCQNRLMPVNKSEPKIYKPNYLGRDLEQESV